MIKHFVEYFKWEGEVFFTLEIKATWETNNCRG